MTWPSFYPTGVPPPSAVKTTGVAFRIANTVPPTQYDFRSYYEEGHGYAEDALWRAVGVSFHLSLEASKAARNRYKDLKNKRIVTGEFLPTHGKMQKTGGKDHLTVWVHVEAKLEESFVEDAEAS